MRAPSFRNGQNGLVLYVAMMMLIALSLLGIAGMQVASMQERMASNYYRANLAFQNAEKSVRIIEAAIEVRGAAYPVDGSSCIFDSLAWAGVQTANQAAYVRRLECIASADSSSDQSKGDAGEAEGNGVAPLYEITVLASDVEHSRASASALIQTIYRPRASTGQGTPPGQRESDDSSNTAVGIFSSANTAFLYGRQSWRQLR